MTESLEQETDGANDAVEQDADGGDEGRADSDQEDQDEDANDPEEDSGLGVQRCVFCLERADGAPPDLGQAYPVPHRHGVLCGYLVHATCAQSYRGYYCSCQQAVDWDEAQNAAPDPGEGSSTAYEDLGEASSSGARTTSVAQGRVTSCVICKASMTVDRSLSTGDVVGVIHQQMGCGQFVHATCAFTASLSALPICACGEQVFGYDPVPTAWSAGQQVGQCSLCAQTITVGPVGSVASNIVSPVRRPQHGFACGRFAHKACSAGNAHPDCLCGAGQIWEFVDPQPGFLDLVLGPILEHVSASVADTRQPPVDENAPLADDPSYDQDYGTFGP